MSSLSYHVVSKICSHMYQVITEVKLKCVFMSLTSVFVLVFETGFHCVAQAGLDLIIQPKLPSKIEVLLSQLLSARS